MGCFAANSIYNCTDSRSYAQLVLRGPMCAKKTFPTHYTTNLNCWHKAGWVHRFILLTLISDTEIKICLYFPNYHLSSLGESVASVASDFYSCPTGLKLTRESSSRFNMLCILRRLHAHHACKECLFFLSNHDLSHQNHASTHRTASHWMFFVCCATWFKLLKLLCIKIPRVSEILKPASLGLSTIPQSESLRSRKQH